MRKCSRPNDTGTQGKKETKSKSERERAQIRIIHETNKDRKEQPQRARYKEQHQDRNQAVITEMKIGRNTARRKYIKKGRKQEITKQRLYKKAKLKNHRTPLRHEGSKEGRKDTFKHVHVHICIYTKYNCIHTHIGL